MPNTHDEPQSRNEALLQNILGEQNEIEEPRSRNEAILKAILDGLDEIPAPYVAPPQSRFEELLVELWENGGGGGEAVLIAKTFTENGEYDATDYDADGFSSVEVAVPAPTLITKNITANGDYAASDDGANGYSGVHVEVPGEIVYYSEYNGTIYTENVVVPDQAGTSEIPRYRKCPHLKTLRCLDTLHHQAGYYQFTDNSSLTYAFLPYIQSVDGSTLILYNKESSENATVQVGSIGYAVTSVASNGFGWGNGGANWTVTLYVNAATLADLPAWTANAPWGARDLSSIIYRNSTTGEVISS